MTCVEQPACEPAGDSAMCACREEWSTALPESSRLLRWKSLKEVTAEMSLEEDSISHAQTRAGFRLTVKNYPERRECLLSNRWARQTANPSHRRLLFRPTLVISRAVLFRKVMNESLVLGNDWILSFWSTVSPGSSLDKNLSLSHAVRGQHKELITCLTPFNRSPLYRHT